MAEAAVALAFALAEAAAPAGAQVVAQAEAAAPARARVVARAEAALAPVAAVRKYLWVAPVQIVFRSSNRMLLHPERWRRI